MIEMCSHLRSLSRVERIQSEAWSTPSRWSLRASRHNIYKYYWTTKIQSWPLALLCLICVIYAILLNLLLCIRLFLSLK